MLPIHPPPTPGVAYIKYTLASSAALAVENLHEVTLNNGAGPRLKVMLAESPSARSNPGSQSYSSAQRSLSQEVMSTQAEDPDNMPPRSRLFIVVPKNALGSEIESRMAEFPGLQYCKTDLIASKGIVFAKYDASSSAYAAMEAVQASGSIAGYRVKVMIAEPKNQRRTGMGSIVSMGSMGSMISAMSTMGSAPVTTGTSIAGMLGNGGSVGSLHGSASASHLNATMNGSGINMDGINGGVMNGSSGMMNCSSGMVDSAGTNTHNGVRSNTSMAFTSSQQPVDLNSVPPGNRLFVVVHKGVNEESLASLFRCYPGMEYLNLKRDRLTGRSKGYAYVNYFNLESATLAQAQLNGIEFPQGSGCMLKVLFAAPLTISSSSRPSERALSVSSGHSGADLTARSSPAKSFLQPGGSHSSTAMNTPSQDTAVTNFQLPSPNVSNSGSDSVGQAFGYGDFGQTVQNTARTDLSSASRDSFVSPLSSPLGKSGLGAGPHSAADHGDNINHIDKIQQSLVDLRLDFGLFDEADEADARSFFAAAGTKSDEAALNKSLRDSIESSFGSFTPNCHAHGGDDQGVIRDGLGGFDRLDAADEGSVGKNNASKSPQREAFAIFAEPPQSDKVYELKNLFEIYGNVENIELVGSKVAKIRFDDADAVQSAVTGVNDLAGVLTVSSSPPQSL